MEEEATLVVVVVEGVQLLLLLIIEVELFECSMFSEGRQRAWERDAFTSALLLLVNSCAADSCECCCKCCRDVCE